MGASTTRRLFVALDLPEPARHALAELAGDVVRRMGGRHVPAESLHVTIAFLGAVPEDLVAPVTTRVRDALVGKAMSTRVTRLVPRPRPGAARLLAAELDDSTGRMSALARAVRRTLGAIDGVTIDERPLWPHVTLVRFGRPTRVRRSPQVGSEHVFDISRASLYDSIISPGASPTYEALCAVSLGTLA